MEKIEAPFEPDPHEEVQLLLPWYQMGRLEPSEQARVRDHLADCARCRAELVAERELRAVVGRAELELERDWSRLAARIRAEERRAGRTARIVQAMARPRRRATPAIWAGAAIAAQLVLICLLGAQLMFRGAPGEYRALGAPPAEAAQIMVAFRPDSAEAAMRQALTTSGARIADGPTATGAYVLQTPRANLERALAVLRARPEISIAESLEPAGAP